MASRRSEEFRYEAVRLALTSGLGHVRQGGVNSGMADHGHWSGGLGMTVKWCQFSVTKTGLGRKAGGNCETPHRGTSHTWAF